ncbi:MAG TPA: hypothetical protein VIE36_14115 [Methylomirabilota bacterium]|jgi:hypothetical protein
MRAHRAVSVVSSPLAALLVLLALGTAVDARLGAVWRVALDSVDDPAAQERGEATPANVPIVHRGGEAAADVALALPPAGRLASLSEAATAAGLSPVAAPRAPPAV